MDGDEVADSLGTVFSGATMLMIGFVLGGVLTLATKIVVARLFSSGLYGVFSQGMALLFTLVMVSMLGLNAGVSRFISYHRGEADGKADSAVPAALLVVIPASVVVFGLMFLFAEQIASAGFSDPRTASVLRIFAVAGPFMAVNSIFIAGFRGHKRSRERVVLLDFVIPGLQILGILALVVLGYGFLGATAGFAAAFLLTAAIALFWYRRDFPLRREEPVLRELVAFSWPLMVSSVAVQVFLWAPSIVVGMLATSRDVGLLNAALPLGAATKMVLSSVAFLFMPVASDLYSRGEFTEMRQVYATATRWILLASVPILAFFAVLPSASIGFLFGADYGAAGAALLLMVFGYLGNLGTGPVGDLLIAVGKTRKEMAANVFKLLVFLGLAVALVPPYGFLGGAAAFAAGMVVGNILRLYFCWEYVGFFYTPAFAKPFVAALPAAAAGAAVQAAGGFLPASLLAYAAVYLAGLLALRPLEAEDRDVIEGVLDRAGLPEEHLARQLLDRVEAAHRS